MRIAIAAVWIWTAIVSFGLYPTASSYQLLREVGITGAFGAVLLYGAASLDLLLGVATLVLRRRRWLWAAQCTVILMFTAIISIALPQFWLHPFAPIAKNVPMLAAIVLLWVLEEEQQWST